MPTAARLMAAVCLAALAFLLSGVVMPLMPESTDFGYFVPVNIVLGLLAGWFVMGKRAGRGTTAAINNGLTGVFVLVLWALFVQSCNEMTRLAMRNRYDDAFEAIVAIFEIGAEWAWTIATFDFMVIAIIGAVLSGLATEFAENRWR
ncbi:TrgA family protein [Sulfitobacter aestuariivivens]|uniref:TrgA family protein n=1 Tax=Sulfitobacter aestuariivivens TaxID=2766981 RepID=A0A927HD23_9RHOB|nr:TrgA family protein [Sulfitobacter aestuariivivens]MBD3663202.1 TrgA family protein [Sulfitobacter aestuariivivens]